jgi:hypothetical protein
LEMPLTAVDLDPKWREGTFRSENAFTSIRQTRARRRLSH